MLSSVYVGRFLILGDLINFKGDLSAKSIIAKEIYMKVKGLKYSLEAHCRGGKEISAH